MHGRRRRARPAADRGQAPGDRLRRPQLRASATSSSCVLPGGVLPGGFEISARKTYGHVSQRHDLLRQRARARRGPRRHHRAAASCSGEEAAARLEPGRRRHRAARPRRRGRRGQRHPRPRLLLLAARHRPRVRHCPPASPSATRPPSPWTREPNGAGYAVAARRRRAASPGRVGLRPLRRPGRPRRRRLAALARTGCSKRLTQVGHAPDLAGRRRHQLRDARCSASRCTRSTSTRSQRLDRASAGRARASSSRRWTTSRATSIPEDLLITDGAERRWPSPASWAVPPREVTDATTDVLVEAAHFDPTTVARSSRRHQLTTEASKRYERGVDPDAGRGGRAARRRPAAWSSAGALPTRASPTSTMRRPREPVRLDTDAARPGWWGCRVPPRTSCDTLRDDRLRGRRHRRRRPRPVLPPSWRPDLHGRRRPRRGGRPPARLRPDPVGAAPGRPAAAG